MTAPAAVDVVETHCPEGNTCTPLVTYPAGIARDGDVVVTLGGR